MHNIKRTLLEETSLTVERPKVKLCPVKLCLYRPRTEDGLIGHLYMKHTKDELLAVIGRTALSRRKTGLKSELVQMVLELYPFRREDA